MESMVIPENEQDLCHQVNQYCRLCLCKAPKLVSLKSRIRKVPVPEMFACLTGIVIDLEDSYPKKVCTVCIDKLGSAYGVRKEFLDNFATLQSFMGSLQNDAIEIKEEYLDEEETVDPVKQIEHADFIKNLETLKKGQSNDLEESSLQVVLEETSTKRQTDSALHQITEPIKLEVSSDSEYEDLDHFMENDEANEADDDPDVPKKKRKYKIRRDPSIPLVRKRKHKIEGEPSEMNPNKCYICQKEFESPRELNTHLPEHCDMLPYTCEPCLTGGGSQKDKIVTVVMLHRHIRMHAGTIACPYCPYRVYTIETLKGHFEREHSERATGTFTCEKCAYQLNSKRLYLDHMKRHEAIEEGKYACHICDRKFGNGPRLKRHLLTHEEKKFQCQYCSIYLRSNTLLLTHEREHADNGAQYACAFCDQRFGTQGARSVHLTTRHPETVTSATQPGRNNVSKISDDLRCRVEGCSHVSNTLSSYYHHKHKHDPKFECPFCGKRMGTRMELNIHVNTHTGEKPHACDFCEKRFNQAQHLVAHRRTHTGERPYLCPHCGDAFESNKRLANHVLQHSAPQHKCEACNKEFRYKGDYTRHNKKYHAEVEIDTKVGILDTNN